MPRARSNHGDAAVAADAVMLDVARFYERLIFPSRNSHPEYARLARAAPGERVGDFGCGASLFGAAWRDHHPTPSFVDRSLPALRSFPSAGRICADLRALPLRDASHDRMLCIGVLHHLPVRAAVWREFARVLAPGGSLVVGVYAPGTLQARLRRLHERFDSAAGRGLVTALTAVLVAGRYALVGRPLRGAEVHVRTRDFLSVPHAEYRPAGDYVGEARAAGLVPDGGQRISGMNLVVLRKPLP